MTFTLIDHDDVDDDNDDEDDDVHILTLRYFSFIPNNDNNNKRDETNRCARLEAEMIDNNSRFEVFNHFRFFY